jgi:hypothetical protein
MAYRLFKDERLRIAKHERQSSGGRRWIERQVCPTGLQDREQATINAGDRSTEIPTSTSGPTPRSTGSGRAGWRAGPIRRRQAIRARHHGNGIRVVAACSWITSCRQRSVSIARTVWFQSRALADARLADQPHRRNVLVRLQPPPPTADGAIEHPRRRDGSNSSRCSAARRSGGCRSRHGSIGVSQERRALQRLTPRPFR